MKKIDSNLKRIAIHSVPRSGSTWLGEIFNSSEKTIYKLQPLFSYALKGRLDSKSTKLEIDKFFEELSIIEDDFIDQKLSKERGIVPIFYKSDIPTHIVYKEVRYHHILENLLLKDKGIKVIGLIRNPLSVINSWINAPKEFRRELGWSEVEEWKHAKKKNLDRVEEFNGYEKWKEVTVLFEKLIEQYPNRFYLLRYNELLINTESTIKKLFEFCNLEYGISTQNFLNVSTNTDQSSEAYSVFRNKQTDDKWVKELNPVISNQITKYLKGTEFEKYLS